MSSLALSARRTRRPRTSRVALALAALACSPGAPAPAPKTAFVAKRAAAPQAPRAAASLCPAEPMSVVPPRPPSASHVELPVVPELPDRPLRVGDAYTVWGASYFLRSPAHHGAFDGKVVTLVGYIVKTNLPDTPRCVIHASGQADPERCSAPIPAFWLADTPHGALSDSIKVMGWASNAAQIFEAIRRYDSARGGDYVDEYWAVTLPNPLPAVGAKVELTGAYGITFAMTSTGAEADPFMGLFTYRAMRVLEAAPEPATLPGIRRKFRAGH